MYFLWPGTLRVWQGGARKNPPKVIKNVGWWSCYPVWGKPASFSPMWKHESEFLERSIFLKHNMRVNYHGNVTNFNVSKIGLIFFNILYTLPFKSFESEWFFLGDKHVSVSKRYEAAQLCWTLITIRNVTHVGNKGWRHHSCLKPREIDLIKERVTFDDLWSLPIFAAQSLLWVFSQELNHKTIRNIYSILFKQKVRANQTKW